MWYLSVRLTRPLEAPASNGERRESSLLITLTLVSETLISRRRGVPQTNTCHLVMQRRKKKESVDLCVYTYESHPFYFVVCCLFVCLFLFSFLYPFIFPFIIINRLFYT